MYTYQFVDNSGCVMDVQFLLDDVEAYSYALAHDLVPCRIIKLRAAKVENWAEVAMAA